MLISTSRYGHRDPKTLVISWGIRALEASFFLILGLWPPFLTQGSKIIWYFLSDKSVFFSIEATLGGLLDGTAHQKEAALMRSSEFKAPRFILQVGRGERGWELIWLTVPTQWNLHKKPHSVGFGERVCWWTHPGAGSVAYKHLNTTGTEVSALRPLLDLVLCLSECLSAFFIVSFITP